MSEQEQLQETVVSSAAHFSRYDRAFQEKIVQALLSDRVWSAQMIEVMTPDYFELKYLKYLTEVYFKYYQKHRSFPTLALIASMVHDDLREGSDRILREQIADFLQRIKLTPNMGDLPHVKERSLDFCRRQALKEALEKCVDLIEGERHEQVVQVMRDAVSVGIPTSTGHDFMDDLEARFVRSQRLAIPTGLDQLDQKTVLNGGLGRGELGIVVAPTGVGKSHFLVHLGAQALKMKKNVLHYTFELSETAVGTRYDSYLTNIPSNEVIDHKDEVKRCYENMELGRLIIKEYPTSTASVITVRSHLEKLLMKSFVPHIILIDYADIMRSTRQYDSLRHELKLIYEELRTLAQDLNVPVWSASQSNREGSNSDIVGLDNMSEAYAKAMVADLVVSISRKPAEKASGVARLFVAKNRAGRDGLLFNIRMDTSRSQFNVLTPGEEVTLEQAMEDDQSLLKSALKQKWKELKEEQTQDDEQVVV